MPPALSGPLIPTGRTPRHAGNALRDGFLATFDGPRYSS